MILIRRLLPRVFSYEDPRSFVNRCRRKRADLIWRCLEQIVPADGKVSVLDVGGGLAFWRAIGLPEPDKYHVTLLNLRAGSVDGFEAFSSVQGDACNLPYEAGAFDVIVSNSVIEHVGSQADRQQMASEIMRVSDRYIVQTPSFWFPLEPHALLPLFQFLPAPFAGMLIKLFRISGFPRGDGSFAACVEGFRRNLMLTESQVRELFPDADLHKERLLGMSKSYMAIHGFSLDSADL